MRMILITLIFVLLAFTGVHAFTPEGCGTGKCTDCHSLSVEEAGGLLEKGVDKVLSVGSSEVPGLWLVEVEKAGQKFPIYLDYSKSYVIAGNVIRLQDNENITAREKARLNRVDVSKIPLEDALLVGSPQASTKAIVFTDPECPFCKRLHHELKEVVRRDSGIAFLIKLFPLERHPNAYPISKSIVCNDSLQMLEDSFEGKPVPPPLCKTDAIDENIALAAELGIQSTPTLILPDGTVLPGYKKADDLLTVLGSRNSPATAGK